MYLGNSEEFGFGFVFVLFDLLHKTGTITIDNYAGQLQVLVKENLGAKQE